MHTVNQPRPDKEMAHIFQHLNRDAEFANTTVHQRLPITLDMMFYYLLNAPSVQTLFKKKGMDLNTLRQRVRSSILEQKITSQNSERETPEFNEMFFRLNQNLVAVNRQEFGSLDILYEIAILVERNPNSMANIILHESKITASEIKDLANSRANNQVQEESNVENWIRLMGQTPEPWVLDKKALESLAQGLSRRKKHHVLLVAESGVGKTSLLEGLGQLLLNHQAPAGLHHLELYSLDWASLVAGANFRGDVEKRFNLLEEYLESKGSGSTLVIDDLHHFLNLGNQGQMDPIGLLLPIMRRGKIRLIVTLTPERLTQLMDRMPGFLNQFQKVEMVEPNAERALEVAHAWLEDYQAHHQVRYTNEVIQRACDLVVRHLPDRRLPEKLLDVLDEAGARVHHNASANRVRPAVSIEEIEAVVASAARLPVAQLAANDVETMRNLSAKLKAKVFGQEEAINVLTQAIHRTRAGLGRGGVTKPMGIFLFAGPTGVGKTEIAKQLSETLAMPLVRFDMSEYMEAHSVSKLIGAPPGYVGFQNGGQLANAVSKNPCSIVLLDEFEKAHPSLHNLFLQVMDDGVMTDGNGRKIDFRQTILILTSNLGATEAKRRGIGFSNQSDTANENRQAVIDKFMAPEFRNRIDRQVIFEPLSKEVMVSIVNRQLEEFFNQAKAKKVELSFDDSLRNYLVEKGYSPEFGARPLLRLLEEKVQTPLASEMLFGRLHHGGAVRLGMESDTLTLTWPQEKEVVVPMPVSVSHPSIENNQS